MSRLKTDHDRAGQDQLCEARAILERAQAAAASGESDSPHLAQILAEAIDDVLALLRGVAG